ncbi:hypothetical protein HDV64DRAFT_264917 [Trichoderma sp. TUCIM 5745]
MFLYWRRPFFLACSSANLAPLQFLGSTLESPSKTFIQRPEPAAYLNSVRNRTARTKSIHVLPKLLCTREVSDRKSPLRTLGVGSWPTWLEGHEEGDT